MSRRGGKSILANFGSFADAKDQDDRENNDTPKRNMPGSTRAPGRVGAGVIGATQRSLSDLIEQRDRLQAIVESGGNVELSPNVIEPSPFPDRLADDTDKQFEEFKRSFKETGQKVPIQVRRHPEKEGVYQVVYGHRRWRAAKELGIALKAVVVELDDSELVVAQGIENGQRQDLTWIERALFVATMDDAGIRTKDIRAALSIDDAELAKMRSVCRVVPRDIIRSIGRAPSVGRPRWLELAAAIAAQGAEKKLRETLSADKVMAMGSDARFRRVLASLKEASPETKNLTKLYGPGGQELGTIAVAKGVVRIALPTSSGADFAEFLERELPSLVEEYASTKSGDS